MWIFPQSPDNCFLITTCHSPAVLALDLSCSVVDHYNKPNTKNKIPTVKWYTYNPAIHEAAINCLACPVLTSHTMTYTVRDRQMYCITVIMAASDPFSHIFVKLRETDAIKL